MNTAAPYRSGLIAGLLFDRGGALSTSPGAVNLAADLLLIDDDLPARLGEVLPTVSTAGWSAPLLKPQPTLAQILETAEAAAKRLPASVREEWGEAWRRRIV